MVCNIRDVHPDVPQLIHTSTSAGLLPHVARHSATHSENCGDAFQSRQVRHTSSSPGRACRICRACNEHRRSHLPTGGCHHQHEVPMARMPPFACRATATAAAALPSELLFEQELGLAAMGPGTGQVSELGRYCRRRRRFHRPHGCHHICNQ